MVRRIAAYGLITLSLIACHGCEGQNSNDGDSLSGVLLATLGSGNIRQNSENPTPAIEGTGGLPNALSAFAPALSLHNAIEQHQLTPLSGGLVFSRSGTEYVPISAAFASDIDVGETHTMTVSLAQSGIPLAGTSDIEGGNSFVFTPGAAMAAGTEYQVDIEATLLDGTTGTLNWRFTSSQTRGTPDPARTEVRMRCRSGADPAALCELMIRPDPATADLFRGKSWDYHMLIFDLLTPSGSIPDRLWSHFVEGFSEVDLSGAPPEIWIRMQSNKFYFIQPNVETAAAPLNPVLTPSFFYMLSAEPIGFQFAQISGDDLYVVYEEYP